MIDVRDPRNPRFAGCFGGDGYVHDAECVIYRGPDVEYFEQEICFCYNEDTFTIVDVTDHANAFVISKTGYMTVGYTHQVNEDYLMEITSAIYFLNTCMNKVEYIQLFLSKM